MQVYRERETVCLLHKWIPGEAASIQIEGTLGFFSPEELRGIIIPNKPSTYSWLWGGKTLDWEKLAMSLGLPELSLRSDPITPLLCDLGQVPNLSEPQLSHQYGETHTYLPGLSWGSYEPMH